MSFWEKLGSLDRRWIFVVIALTVTIFLLLERPAPVRPSPIVQDLFDQVEALPAGSRVILSLDYGPSTQPENDPMTFAVARHCLRKDLKLYIMTIWATGPPLAQALLQQAIVPEFPDKQYGIDYVNLGYKVGNQGAIQALTSDFKGQYTADVGIGEIAPRPIDEIPMMETIATISDFDMILAIGSGFPGVKEWVQFAGDPTGVTVGGGVTAVEAPLLYPYYPQQLVGLMGGLAGAAEYEAALGSVYEEFLDSESSQVALIRMYPQTVAHLVIVSFVILGNISYFAQRRRQRKY